MCGGSQPCRSRCVCKWCNETYTVTAYEEDSDEGVCPECAGVAEWASETVFPQWDEQD